MNELNQADTSYYRNNTDKAKGIKHVVTIILVAVAGAFLYRTLFSQPALISVVGDGRVDVKPEEARITATIATVASSGLEAMRSARTLANAITQSLVSDGIDKNDIRVLNLGIASAGTGTSSLVYAASGAIEVTVRSLANTDKAVDRLLSLGVKDITSIIYLPKDAQAVEAQAVELAIKNAKQRAKEIAKSSGKRLGRMRSLTTTETGEATALTTKGTAGDQIEVYRQATIVYEVR